MTEIKYTVRNSNESDEYGLFLSILYLACESHKKQMFLTTATLLTSAQSLIDECEGRKPSLANDLSAALALFKQSLHAGDYLTAKKVASLSDH